MPGAESFRQTNDSVWIEMLIQATGVSFVSEAILFEHSIQEDYPLLRHSKLSELGTADHEDWLRYILLMDEKKSRTQKEEKAQ
jgi:hypothetical protein